MPKGSMSIKSLSGVSGTWFAEVFSKRSKVKLVHERQISPSGNRDSAK